MTGGMRDEHEQEGTQGSFDEGCRAGDRRDHGFLGAGRGDSEPGLVIPSTHRKENRYEQQKEGRILRDRVYAPVYGRCDGHLAVCYSSVERITILCELTF